MHDDFRGVNTVTLAVVHLYAHCVALMPVDLISSMASDPSGGPGRRNAAAAKRELLPGAKSVQHKDPSPLETSQWERPGLFGQVTFICIQGPPKTVFSP